MKIDDYEEFNLGLEDAAHASIPHIVRGDFLMFTAPYGKCYLPVFMASIQSGYGFLLLTRSRFFPSPYAA
jgi:hypothetical protein